jgi:nitrogen fixation protein FixH
LKPGALWPIAIVGVLAVMVGGNIAVLVATRDPHADAIDPNYYAKATAWDTTMARARANVALGWRSDARLERWTRGGTPLVVALADSAGVPVTGAGVHVELVDNLAPDRPLEAVVHETGKGRYEANVALPRPGLWELRLQVRRDSTFYSADLRRETAP